ncbi:MAG: hypothetical protein BWX79_02685 [Alphaproteobacteria bacterium ADurb.Bin100]|nr:MAG: hypothetical protein BWX79_02685 [Alphaproteobacteria bacterium ADurb.Bin100]
MPRKAFQRSAQLNFSPAGACSGSREVMITTVTISSAAVSRPGMTPAANSLPMFVSVTMP